MFPLAKERYPLHKSKEKIDYFDDYHAMDVNFYIALDQNETFEYNRYY